MKALWLRVRWRLLTAAVPAGVFIALALHEQAWAWLSIFHVRPYFVDLASLLASGQAWQAGRDVYAWGNPFFAQGAPLDYGPWWLVSGPLGLTVADARWLGPLLGLAFFMTAAAVLAPRRPGVALVAVLLLASPPVLLGVERGNCDLIIFLLFAAAGAWLAGRAALAGAGLIGLGAVLKYYPLAALPALAARAAPRRRVLAWMGATLLACLLVVLCWWSDYRRALALVPRPETLNAFGLAEIGLAWQKVRARPGGLLAAALPALVLAVGWLGWQARALWTAVPRLGSVAAWFVAGAATWGFCYLATASYTYRAVLLLLPARLWLDQTADPVHGRAARGQLAAWMTVFWLQSVKWWLTQLLGQAMGRIASPAGVPWVNSWLAESLRQNGGARAANSLVAVIGLEQVLVAALTAALLISLAGWLWRWWRAEGDAGDCAGAAAANARQTPTDS